MPRRKVNVSEIAALASLAGGGALDDETKALLQEELREAALQRREERESWNRFREASGKEHAVAKKARAAMQAACRHRKEDETTALAGQHMQNGQTVLICQKCIKEFHHPPKEGQESPPMELVPKSVEIGGPINHGGVAA